MSWLKDHPEVRSVRVGAADLNGQPRGKRLPVDVAALPFTQPGFKR